MARRPKYNKEVDYYKIFYWIHLGWTNKKMAQELEITEKTLYNWANRDDDLLQLLKRNLPSINGQVTAAYLKRCLGTTVKDKKTIFDPQGDKDAQGNPKPKIVRIENTEKEILPDAKHCLDWLRSRDHDNWKDRHVVEHGGEIKTNLADVLAEAWKQIEEEDALAEAEDKENIETND